MQAFTLDAIRAAAPSVFATQPWHAMSATYRFFPTSDIVAGLMQNGFVPVRAQQSRCRLPDKSAFTRHLLRFRQAAMTESAPGTEVPALVLLNSHDGTSAYHLRLGLFRIVCTNGLVVKSAGIEEIRVRHSGRQTLSDEVIEGSYRVIEQAPKALAQVDAWRQVALTPPEQGGLAEAALAVRETALTVPPAEILRARRFEDGRHDAPRDAWRTLNVIQENLMRGGRPGVNSQGQRRRMRGVHRVDGDTKFNRALWLLTERMAARKGDLACNAAM